MPRTTKELCVKVETVASQRSSKSGSEILEIVTKSTVAASEFIDQKLGTNGETSAINPSFLPGRAPERTTWAMVIPTNIGIACSVDVRIAEIKSPKHIDVKPSRTARSRISRKPFPRRNPVEGTGRLNKTIEVKMTD